MRLAQSHPDWVLGFADEVWWRRFAQPRLRTWSEAAQPTRLIEQSVASADPDPQALAWYGLLRPDTQRVWLRFVDGRPVSTVTTQFLAWCLERLAQEGRRALLLVWDNASWHTSRAVRTWAQDHNRQVKQAGHGVRLVLCPLPVKSPWLNPIEPQGAHGKRHVVQPDRRLSVAELADRVCAYYGCAHEPHLAIPEKAA